MLSYVAIFLSLVAIVLLIIVLIRFKKNYSITDSVTQKLEAKMNRFITDVNNNASRDLDLINEATKRINALMNDADRKMELFREATQRLRDMIAETEKAGSAKLAQTQNSPMQSTTFKNPPIPDLPKQNPSKQNPSIKNQPLQNTLFDRDETNITPDGTAYKEVPLLKARVYDDKTVVSSSNKPLKEKVEKLFNQGMQINDIAKDLSCSISEVQFIIDML